MFRISEVPAEQIHWLEVYQVEHVKRDRRTYEDHKPDLILVFFRPSLPTLFLIDEEYY